MALEVLSIVITPVIELGKYLVREVCYVTEYNSYFSKFQEELPQLQVKRDDVQRDVENARSNLKEPRGEVLSWVKRVEELEKKCMPLTTNNSTDNKCLMGRLCSRRRISKKILKLTKDICELKEEGSFNDIAHQRPSRAVVPMDPMGTVENIPSRELIMNQVMEALEDDNIRSIGVHGMGGIGKTTLVTSINNKLAGNLLFKKVIMVTVSKDPDVKIIQHKIAERLALTLGEQDMATRADKLCERLRDEGRVLIILDDVWEVMELGDIGLRHSTEHMPCKLIMTTRNANLCSRMKVQKKIKMGILHKDEAWTLFEAKAGNVLVEMPSLVPTAREIVRRCKGSPLAISVLGSTLGTAEEEAANWAAHALLVLEEPNAVCLEGIMNEVVTSLRWSYDQLKPNVQQCFLYCCLFPEDYNIRLTDLRNSGIGEGFLKMTSSLKEAQNELSSYIKILKDCGLLLDGEYGSSVRMHDVVRDVAICIASNDEDGNGFLVNIGGGSKYLPESDKLRTYKRISYMNNRDMLLPNALECPQLRSLLIRENVFMFGRFTQNISFEGVKSLLVLHMSWGTAKLSVSKSISQLRNLRTLYLDGCDLLDKTYLLGGLTKLQVLSMRRSNISVLPVEFGNLINLKFLDLTRARICFVAPNVFSRFLKMEELLISDSIKGWDTTGELIDDDGYRQRCIADDGSRRFAELKEVLSLPRLSVLDIVVDRPLLEGEVLNHRNLQNFRISVDRHVAGREDFSCDKNNLYIGRRDLGKHVIGNLLAVSKKNLDLILRECGGFKSVTDLNPAGSFSHLHYLSLEKCNEVESVIVADRSPITAQDSFEKLKRLELRNMDKMERILHGATSSPKFFGKLEFVNVRKCSKICTILPANLLFTENRLENLKQVHVQLCDEAQHIFNTEDNEFGAMPATTAVLSGVTDIRLSYLPKLESIWKGTMPEGSFQGLIRLSVKQCRSLQHLLPSDVAGLLQNLEDIYIRECAAMETIICPIGEDAEETSLFPRCKFLTVAFCSNLKSIWKGITPEGSFQGLTRLSVSYCNSLKHLLPTDVAGLLQNLQEIKIENCAAMETIICPIGEEAEETSLFPRCKFLTVAFCSNLKSIWKGITPEGSFQGLTRIFVEQCHSLKHLLPSDVAGLLQNLEEIKIEKCYAMETIIFPTREEAEGTSLFPRCRLLTVDSCPKLNNIWKGITPEGSFQGLTRLSVSYCNSLKHLLPSDVAGLLQNLEEIKIENCAAMETIICPIGEEAEETSLFPRCRLLTIRSCHKLKNIFSFGVAGHLHKLNKLSISHCHGLRQVFGNGDEPRVTEHQCLLPELKYLELVYLRSLTRFDQDSLPISGHLQEIKVFLCPNLTRLPLQTLSALKFIHAEDIWFRNLELEDEIQASILKPFFQPYSQAIPVPAYWGINEKLHPLLWKVAGLWLDDYDSQLEGTTQFRELLSGGYLDNMPFWDVEKSGVFRCLVELLTRDDHTQLQSEAAWVLANIASRSSDYTELVIDYGTLPIFVKLLCSPNEDIKEHAIWGLGNIASHSPEHRHLVLQHVCLIPVLALLNDCDSVSILSNALRTIYNIFDTEPQPPFKQMKLALPAIQRLLYSNDEGVCSNACRALSCLLDGTSDKIKVVTEAGVFAQLMDLLTHPSPLVLSSALHAVGNIVCRDNGQTPCNIDCQALLGLSNLLTHHDVSIKKDVCCIISNITSGSEEWIQVVIEAKIIAPVVQLLETAESGIKKEAARAISNATCRGSQDQIKHLVEQGCIKPFCDLLHCSDSSIVVLCLKGLSNILKVGETGGLGVLNKYVDVIDDSGGFKNIADHLQGHDNVEIQKTALILLKYHDEHRVSQGNAAEASFQSGNSESQCVEKGFLRSTELENPASDSAAKSKKPGAIHLKRRRIRHITNKQAKHCRVASRTKQNAGTKSSVYGRVALDDMLHTVSLAIAKENNAAHHENDGNTFKEVPNKEHILTSAQLRRKLNAEHLHGESSKQPPKE